MLQVENLRVCYGKRPVVQDVSFEVPERQWLMIAGPNGAGKSTILKALSQGVGYEGRVLFQGADMAKMKAADRAHKIGMLAQSHHVGYGFTVEEVVRLGRYAYTKGMLAAPEADEEEKVEEALRLTGMLPFRKKSVLALSGGELQRTFLAQLLAQDPQLLLLDEPANHLDLKFQQQLYELVGQWIQREGRAVISVVHDLSVARQFGTGVLLLREGCVVEKGVPLEVLNRKNLQDVYDMDVVDWMLQSLDSWQRA